MSYAWTDNAILLHHGVTGSSIGYDNTVWGTILGIPVGEPLNESGTRLFDSFQERLRSALSASSDRHLCGDVITEDVFCPSECYSDRVQLASGDITSVAGYSTILVSCHWLYLRYIQWLGKRFSSKSVIGIQEDSLAETQYAGEGLQARVVRAYQKLDGFLAYNTPTLTWIQALSVPTLRVNHPITERIVRLISEHRLESEQKEQEIRICLGVHHWNYDFSNTITSLLVAKRIHEMYPECQFFIVGIREYKIDAYKEYRRVLPQLEVYGFQDTGDLYKLLGSADLLVQLETRPVAGRVSAECACLGVPCIGNVSADMQEYCWPDVSVDPYHASRTVDYARKLTKDRCFRRSVLEKARKRIMSLKDRKGSEVQSFVGDLSDRTEG